MIVESYGPAMSRRLLWLLVHLLAGLGWAFLVVMVLGSALYGEGGDWDPYLLTPVFAGIVLAAVVLGQVWLGSKRVELGPGGLRIRDVTVPGPALPGCRLEGGPRRVLLVSEGRPTVVVAGPAYFSVAQRAALAEGLRRRGCRVPMAPWMPDRRALVPGAPVVVRASWAVAVPWGIAFAALAFMSLVVRRTRSGEPISLTEGLWTTGVAAALLAIVLPLTILRSQVRLEGDTLTRQGPLRRWEVPVAQIAEAGMLLPPRRRRSNGEGRALVVRYAAGNELTVRSRLFSETALDGLAAQLRTRGPAIRPITQTWRPSGRAAVLPRPRWYERRWLGHTVLWIGVAVLLVVVLAGMPE
ncbi:hypothetical protein [Cumulibacter manganitolerans]|uniref:hypothetical protein n=1 Tax=Cumulibacter manganitolerans TaxID=1884992 RepID=UPI001297A699|nr:hypothetical protein [Cumulibacter manganitolerans]